MTDLTEAKMPKNDEPLTKKERLNRNILIGCALLGGITGGAMAMVVPDLGEQPLLTLSNSEIPASAAIIFAIIWGFFLPVISIFWHRTVDEQEAHAYKEGAYYAFYFYAIAAPVWWILWRGGLVPEPNGIVIYYTTLLICGAVWVKKKYMS